MRAVTPIYDKLIAKLEVAANKDPQGHDFIQYIANSCFYADLLHIGTYGERLENAIPLSVKMETLLQHAQKQRQICLKKLKRRNNSGAEPVLDIEMRIDEEDMRNMYNEWRAHPE